MVEKQLNKEATDDRRSCRNDHNNRRRDGSTHRNKDDDDDIIWRIKVEASTFDGVHDSWIFNDWLVDMDYYFDWYRISKSVKFDLLGW